MSTQFTVNMTEEEKKQVIIFIFSTVWSQQGFSLAILCPLSSLLTNPFLPGTHFNHVAPMSITLFPFIPSSKAQAKNTWASRLQRLPQLQSVEESVKGPEITQQVSSHLLQPRIHAGGTNRWCTRAELQNTNHLFPRLERVITETI